MTESPVDGARVRVRSGGFDVWALFEALDERRRRDRLSWVQTAREMWDLSADLNAQLETPSRSRLRRSPG